MIPAHQEAFTNKIVWGLNLIMVVATGISSVLLPSPFLSLTIWSGILILWLALQIPLLTLLLFSAALSLPSIILPLPLHNLHLVEPASLLIVLTLLFQRQPLRLTIAHYLSLLFLLLALLILLAVPDLPALKRFMGLFIMVAALYIGGQCAILLKHPQELPVQIWLVHLPLFLIFVAQWQHLPWTIWLEHPQARINPLTEDRLWGSFPWPVNAGLYLLTLFALMTGYTLCNKQWRVSIVGWLCMAITACAIIATGTRSATLTAMFVLFLGFLLTRRYILGGLIIGTGLILSWLCYQSFIDHFTHDISSINNRLFLWTQGIYLAIDHLWFGIGLQQFPHYYDLLNIDQTNRLSETGTHLHQQYLTWVVEGGIVWFIVGIGLLICMISTSWQRYHHSTPSTKAIASGTFLALVAHMLTGLVDTPLDQLEGGIFLFFLVGLTLGLDPKNNT